MTGSVVFALFDSANTFGDLRDPVKMVIQPLDGRLQYEIKDLPSGEYALLVYFDENNNQRIDKNFIGIPKEPLGFSNRYQPKGPPSYSRAAFILKEGEPQYFKVKLTRPLGKLGRVGLGVGVLAYTTPYRDYDGHVYRVLPAVTYAGERLQIYGTKLQMGLLGSGNLRLALTGKYRIGVYEEDKSPFLTGMGDRKDTLMAGLAVQAKLPGGLGLAASYEHDVLDRIGGGEMSLKLNKSFQFGVCRFSPQIAANWLSDDMALHDFGVPTEKATPYREAYDIGDTLSVEAGLNLLVELTPNWLAISSLGVELLDSEVTDSPIIEDEYVVKGFMAISYLF